MKTPRIFLLLTSLVIILALTLAACAPAPAAAPTEAPKAEPTKAPMAEATEAPAAAEPTAAPAAEPLRVAMVLGCKIDDGDWCQAGYEGLQEAINQFGDKIETTYTEDTTIPDMEKVMRDFASQGYDLVICHSSIAKEGVMNAAKDFPDTKFVWTDGDEALPNMAVVSSMTQEASYLAGLIAGKLTKSNVVGMVGAMDIPSTHRGYAGFEMGLKEANPDAKLLVNWTGDFTDLKGAKEATLSQIEAGADIIHGNGGSLNLGTLQGASEKGVLAIGAVRDQFNLAPNVVLTSVEGGFKKGFPLIIGDVLDGKFKAGGMYELGLAEGTELSDYHDNASKIPDDVKALVEQKKKDILSGALVIPNIESGK